VTVPGERTTRRPDYESHQFDLAGYFADQSRPAWVLAGIDYCEENVMFGAHNENHASATWAYESGGHGLASTGDGDSLADCHDRLVGSTGEIVIGDDDHESPLRVRRDGEGWESIDCEGEGIHHPAADRSGYVTRSVASAVDGIDGAPSELRVENALGATALIFGAWESVRRRGRVDDPLDMAVDDNPLESMVEDGSLTPEPADE
jgi:predicted dehydrogenase